jgi:hypothetical protein
VRFGDEIFIPRLPTSRGLYTTDICGLGGNLGFKPRSVHSDAGFYSNQRKKIAERVLNKTHFIEKAFASGASINSASFP